MPKGKFYISPQEPDSTISTLLRTDSSVYDDIFIVEEPDTLTGNVDDTTIQAQDNNDTAILSTRPDTGAITVESHVTETAGRSSEVSIVRTDAASENAETVPEMQYDPDTITFLSPHIKNNELFNQNFLYNLLHTRPFEEKTDSTKISSQPVDGAERTPGPSTREYTEEVPEIKYLAAKEINTVSKDWMIGVILFTLFILAWLRLFYKKFLLRTINATYNTSILNKLFQESNSISQRVSVALNLIFIINIGLFIFQILNYYDITLFTHSNFYTLLILCCIVIGVYMIKYLSYKILGFIFLAQKDFSEYLHSIFIFNKTLGLLLFPIIIGISYMPDSFNPVLINTGIVLFFAGYLLRILKGGQICYKINVSIFYMFLYLCTLEITPMFLFYKLLTPYI